MVKKNNPCAKKARSMATAADKHRLYERAVQCVEAEIDFVNDTFKSLKHRAPKTLREDFCGTAKAACEWVRRRRTNIAHAVDIDAHVLDWGRRHNFSKLPGAARKRLHVHNDNVLTVEMQPVDIVLAMNFSYWIFKDRKSMKKYFRRIHASLVGDGVFFLDAFGGYEAFREMEESTPHKNFTYVWDQEHYNPINGHGTFHIHFKFKDGSKLKQAFTYDWRVWTLPELTELLEESGFKATVYWEGTDKKGEGNGVFTPATQGEADAGWIAYIVAEKKKAPASHLARPEQ